MIVIEQMCTRTFHPDCRRSSEGDLIYGHLIRRCCSTGSWMRHSPSTLPNFGTFNDRISLVCVPRICFSHTWCLLMIPLTWILSQNVSIFHSSWEPTRFTTEAHEQIRFEILLHSGSHAQLSWTSPCLGLHKLCKWEVMARNYSAWMSFVSCKSLTLT